MELTIQMLLIVCPLVFLAGLVDSIAGGGGLIALPAFLLAGLPPHTAIATNKLSSTIGTTVSAARLAKHLDIPVAAVSVACALLGSSLGSRLSLLTNERVIEYMLIPILLVVAYYVLRKKNMGTESEERGIPRSRMYVLSAIASLSCPILPKGVLCLCGHFVFTKKTGRNYSALFLKAISLRSFRQWSCLCKSRSWSKLCDTGCTHRTWGTLRSRASPASKHWIFSYSVLPWKLFSSVLPW